MRDELTAVGRGHLSIRKKLHVHAELRGAFRLIEEDRATGERVEGPWVENTVVNQGKEAFLDRMRGVGAAWSQSVCRLTLRNGSTVRQTITGTHVAPSHATLRRIVFEWRDPGNAVYSNVDNVIFSHSGNAFQFSTKDVSFGSKTEDKMWIVQYRLDFNAGSPDLVLTANEGLDLALRFFTGNVTTTFFDGSSQLLVFTTAARTDALGPQTVDATFPQRTGQTLTYKWTVPDNAMSGPWYGLLITRLANNPPGGPIVTGTRLRDLNDQLGTKQTLDEWVWTYTFTI
jgi:hypothetical protein